MHRLSLPCVGLAKEEERPECTAWQDFVHAPQPCTSRMLSLGIHLMSFHSEHQLAAELGGVTSGQTFFTVLNSGQHAQAHCLGEVTLSSSWV
jgi:hypothetical protein